VLGKDLALRSPGVSTSLGAREARRSSSPAPGRNFNWSPHTRQIIIDATVLSARVHGISRSADSGIHRYVGQLTILVGQLTIAIVIQ